MDKRFSNIAHIYPGTRPTIEEYTISTQPENTIIQGRNVPFLMDGNRLRWRRRPPIQDESFHSSTQKKVNRVLRQAEREANLQANLPLDENAVAGKKKKKKKKSIKAGRDVNIKKKKKTKAGRDIVGKRANVINIKNVVGGKGGGASGGGGGGAAGPAGPAGPAGAPGVVSAAPPMYHPSPAPHIPPYYAPPVYQNEHTPGFDMSSRASSVRPPFYIPTPSPSS